MKAKIIDNFPRIYCKICGRRLYSGISKEHMVCAFCDRSRRNETWRGNVK